MKKLRQRFERFCFANRNKGIPNLMLYICSGAAVMAFMSYIDNTNLLYNLFCFNRVAILQGQVWRLFTYPLCFSAGSVFTTAISLVCYYSIGRAIENVWGTLRFNLFYLTGVVLTDLWCLVFGGQATVYYLNMSLFLAYATMYPDSQFLLFFVIPVKAWIFAVLDLAVVFIGLLNPFPMNVYPLIALGNYFLFFGRDVLNVLPVSWRVNARRAARKAASGKNHKTIPFNNAGSWEASHATVKAPYNHKCTVCGRTDADHPELEFRYCSRCRGYYCYCSEHTSNHTHIE